MPNASRSHVGNDIEATEALRFLGDPPHERRIPGAADRERSAIVVRRRDDLEVTETEYPAAIVLEGRASFDPDHDHIAIAGQHASSIAVGDIAEGLVERDPTVVLQDETGIGRQPDADPITERRGVGELGLLPPQLFGERH